MEKSAPPANLLFATDELSFAQQLQDLLKEHLAVLQYEVVTEGDQNRLLQALHRLDLALFSGDLDLVEIAYSFHCLVFELYCNAFAGTSREFYEGLFVIDVAVEQWFKSYGQGLLERVSGRTLAANVAA